MRFIDADALKQTVNDNEYLLSDSINSLDYGMFTVGIMQAINEQPTADVRENVRGEWIVQDGKVVCSECLEQNLETDFCPNCGADMQKEVEE